MLREPAKRTVRAANVALVALAVCLGSGLSPATAANPGSNQQPKCPHTSASCQSERNRDHRDDSDKHKHKHKRPHPHPSKSTSTSASVTPSVAPSATFHGTATATGSSTASATSTATAPSTSSTTAANTVPSQATDPATAAQNSAVALIPQNPPRRTPINTAPTGGGQLPQPVSSAKATRSSAASTSTAAAIVPRPAIAAPIDPPLGETMFGIDSSLLLAATVGLFTLAVTVMVAGGHRRVRRIH